MSILRIREGSRGKKGTVDGMISSYSNECHGTNCSAAARQIRTPRKRTRKDTMFTVEIYVREFMGTRLSVCRGKGKSVCVRHRRRRCAQDAGLPTVVFGFHNLLAMTAEIHESYKTGRRVTDDPCPRHLVSTMRAYSVYFLLANERHCPRIFSVLDTMLGMAERKLNDESVNSVQNR
jgi:hypothetical protein